MVKGPTRLIGVTERMDRPQQDPRSLRTTLEHLAWINRWCGAERALVRSLAPLRSRIPSSLRILDVATGYADLPRALVRWARRRGMALDVEALDHHGQIVALAAAACRGYPEIHICAGDALALPYPDASFDLVTASLLLHHLEADAPIRLLRELDRVARRIVLVSDLRRGRWPFLVAWLALHLVSRDPMIRHDGPLSVRRGFLPDELVALAREAGWTRPRVRRHPFFRLTLVGVKP
jgi:2-polyprenyl-3-methyl-5-hydroxy-6-metoxy-1,4-benzoquinol methylase